MSTTTKALQFIDTLQKQGVDRPVATTIINFVESQQGGRATKSDVNWLRWATLAGFTLLTAFMIGGFTLLNTRVEVTRAELKADINKLESKIDQRMDKIDQRIDKLEGKIDQLLLRQKR